MNISIIIPTYNSAKTIQTNIDSIKAQSFKDYQLIIIDNKFLLCFIYSINYIILLTIN